METTMSRLGVQSKTATRYWYHVVLVLLLILNGALSYSSTPEPPQNQESTTNEVATELSLQSTTNSSPTEENNSTESITEQHLEITAKSTKTTTAEVTEQPQNEPLSETTTTADITEKPQNESLSETTTTADITEQPQNESLSKITATTDITEQAQNESVSAPQHNVTTDNAQLGTQNISSTRNVIVAALPAKNSNANITVQHITHKSAIIFWELLNENDDSSYRLVGYKLTSLMDVEDKITDISVNASKQPKSRLLQENLLHNTIYMFCVLPLMVSDMKNSTHFYGDVSNGLNVLNTSDCNSFKTPYNPMNIKAIIAFGCAVFILVVFFCTAITSQFYEKTVEEEKEERKQLVDQLIQAKRQRRKQGYGSDKLRLSTYKLVDNDAAEVSESEASELQPDDIELDKISIQDSSSDTGYLLGDMK